jgi:integrase/recombinase XerD
MNPQPQSNSKNSSQNLLELKPYDGFLSLCKSPHTRENYHQDLRTLKQFLDTSNIHTPLDVRPEHMVRFAASLAKPGTTPSGKLRKAYSTRTMKRILASTRSFYRYLASIQHITNDPTAVFHNLSIRSPQRNPRPLPPKDREALVRGLRMDDLEGQKVSLVILFGYHCGLRVSEIAHLKIRDLDLTQGLVTVIGKGDKERIVPMTEALKGLLKLFIDQKIKNQEESPYLFPSPRSALKPIHPDYVETWVKKAAQWAQFENPNELTVHVLRHSFGTQLAESGASVYEIRDLMGHSSIMVSENYVKLVSTKTRQAHGKAFGSGYKVHALKLGSLFGIESVLKRFRTMSQRALRGESDKG